MQLLDLLPMPFWEGPPFPRFLGVYWPWRSVQSVATYANIDETEITLLGPSFFRRKVASEPMEEEVELIRDETGAIKKLIKRRSTSGG